MKITNKIFAIIILIALCTPQVVFAKKIDATLSIIMSSTTEKSDLEKIAKEFGKNFSSVQSFDLIKKTNFYLYYFVTDENFIQYQITKRDIENLVGENTNVGQGATGDLGTARYEAFKRDNKLSVQFSSGARDIKTTKIVKPFKGTMILYNSYGTELIKIESKEHYKTESGTLKNTAAQMRRAINGEKEKMAIRQKFRCLFCDYENLKDRQKEKILHLAYIAHKNQIEQLYGEIAESELPIGLVPYANIYAALKDYRTLEDIFDKGVVDFNEQVGTRKLPGHLINELIKNGAPQALLDKVAISYQKNKFQELDINNHTPLWSAIYQKDVPLIEKLILLGADVNQVTKIGGNYLTPLIISAQLGTVEISELLVNHGAQKKLATQNGLTAWSSAMWLAKYDHAQLLWPDDIIDPNSRQARNLLTQAVYFGQLNRVNELVEKGVPVTARGLNNDNIIISAIKGIRTFAIKETNPTLGSTQHSINEEVYWSIISKTEELGLSDPLTSSIDTKKQTVLFYAYPDGSQEVTDQHIKLFTRIIKGGVDPMSTNTNGQNADQVYQAARFAYLDEWHKNQLAEINQQRRLDAMNAQQEQDEAMQVALEEITKTNSFRAWSRTQSQAKRLKSLEKMDERARSIGSDAQTTSFEKDTSDVDRKLDPEMEKAVIAKGIRDAYSEELMKAESKAIEKMEELEGLFEKLKQEEIRNSKIRQAYISQIYANL